MIWVRLSVSLRAGRRGSLAAAGDAGKGEWQGGAWGIETVLDRGAEGRVASVAWLWQA